VPVIVIGNISVGGTGKTPLVIFLAQWLKSQGYQPGIVSRGYGGKATHWPQEVTADSDPILVGDEPVLIAKRTSCPMAVSPNRPEAVQKLINENKCNIIISDDGLQHYALGRDIEIAVINGQQKFGNGFLLPAGPLREPVSRLKSVDFVVTNGQGTFPFSTFKMQLIPGEIYQVSHPMNKLNLDDIHQPIQAIAGIGNPQRFFDTLKSLNLQIIEHPFPDHHAFKLKDIDFGQDALILMTEKDAVKCQAFANERCWCLPVEAKVDAKFIQNLQKKLNTSKK